MYFVFTTRCQDIEHINVQPRFEAKFIEEIYYVCILYVKLDARIPSKCYNEQREGRTTTDLVYVAFLLNTCMDFKNTAEVDFTRLSYLDFQQSPIIT